MSGAGPYAEGAPMEGATVLLDGGGPEGMLVFGIQLAGWRWPLALRATDAGDLASPSLVLSCSRAGCTEVLHTVPCRELEDGWKLDALVLADYAAGHLPTCRAGEPGPS